MTSFCYLPVGDMSVALRGTGTGEPVVLLHSSASSSAQWREVAAALSADWRVLTPDFPGYGESGAWPGRRARSLDADADIVGAIARDLDRPVHLVGHSYGGAVALTAALRHPDALASLMVIEPVAFQLLDDACLAEIRELATGVFEGLCSGEHHAPMARFVDYWNGPGAWQRLSPARQQGFAGLIDRIAQEFTATLGSSLRARDYARIRIPTTVVRGARSPEPAQRIAELLVEAVAKARPHAIAGAGHMLPLTHGRETAGAIARHLRHAGFPAMAFPARAEAA